MDYDLIVVKTLERVYKNYYYIIRGVLTMKSESTQGGEMMQKVIVAVLTAIIMIATEYLKSCDENN